MGMTSKHIGLTHEVEMEMEKRKNEGRERARQTTPDDKARTNGDVYRYIQVLDMRITLGMKRNG